MVKLGFSICLSNNCASQPLSGNDTKSTDHAAYTQVDEHALLSVSWTHPKSSKCRGSDDDSSITQEARRDDKVLHRLDVSNRALLWSVEDDDHTANDAIETANFPDKAEPLFEKDGRENRRNNHTQSAQRRDQDRINKSIGNKVAYFAHDHQCHAAPPPRIFEVAVAFSRLFVVFSIGFEKSHLLQHKRCADEQA